MSLINDALRRAKQAQQDTPPPTETPVPHFRPVEPGVDATRHGVGLMVSISFGLVALLALLLLWELSRRENSPSSATPKSALNVAARVPSPSELPPASSEPQAQPTSSPEGNSTAKPIAVDSNSNATADHPAIAAIPVASGSVSTNVSSVALDPADSVPLKLQGIVFNPRKPSALINGRVMFVGDRIRDLRIWAIHPDNVVLTGPGRTNVLSMEP